MNEAANERMVSGRAVWWRRVLGAIFDLLKETALAWHRDKASRLAAALSYYAIFSLTPLLVVIIALLGLVFGERAAQAEIAHQIEGVVGLEAAVMLETMLANFGNPASGILTSFVGLMTLLYGATGLFNHVQGALNTIWHAPPRTGNGVVHFFKQRALHVVMIFGVGALLLLSLFAELVITAVTEYFNLESFPQMRNFFVALAMLTVLFAVIFKTLPQVKIAWRDVLIGAVVTSLLFNVGRILINAYMRWSNIGSIFGAAGSLAALLVWVYYSAQIFLLGAEFTHVYALKFGSLRKPPPPVEEAIVSLPSAASIKTDNAPLSVPPAAAVEPVPPSAETKHRAWPKKALAVTTMAGTIVASAFGARWLYRKRKGKSNETGLPTSNLTE